MTRHYSNTAIETTLAAPCTDVATSVVVTATTGFPAADFVLALDYGVAGQELVLVTNVAGTTLTVTRGYDSTPATAHASGAAVRHVHTSQDFRDSRTHEDSTSGVHGISGDVVGTTDVQALSNKNLSSGNTFPTTLALAADLTAHEADTTTHGVTGALVGTTDAQTLTSKDLSSPTNTFPDFATAAEVNTALPVGSMQMWPAAAAPSGWFNCAGQAISRATYADLFAVCGTTYGAGDGASTFNLPNLTARFPRGSASPGGIGGSATKDLSHQHLGPSHSHTIFAATADPDTESKVDGAGGFTPTHATYAAHDHGGVTGNSGTGSTTGTNLSTTEDIMPPYLDINFIIKATNL